MGKSRDVRRNGGERVAFPWGNEPPEASKANLFENSLWAPAPIGSFPAGQNSYGCHQLIGDVWEWTTSIMFPTRFKSEFDEYNDKWFVHQKVLRGGSYATPRFIFAPLTATSFTRTSAGWFPASAARKICDSVQ